MELLILKYKDKYIKYKDGQYFFCGMDKASVFPIKNAKEILDHILNLHKDGFSDATVMKLIIKEIPFNINNWINHYEPKT